MNDNLKKAIELIEVEVAKYDELLASNVKALEDAAATFGTIEFDSNLSKAWGNFIKRMFAKGINTQKSMDTDPEHIIGDGHYHKGYAVTGKRFGIKRLHYKTVKYYKTHELWHRVTPYHVALIKDLQKRKCMEEMILFRDKAQELMSKGGKEEITLEQPITVHQWKPLSVSVDGKHLQALKESKECTITKVQLNGDGKGAVAFGLHKDEISTGYAWREYDTYFTVTPGGIGVDRDAKLVEGLHALVKAPEVISHCEKMMSNAKVIAKTWDYLQEKYSFFLFMSGSF